MSEPHLLEGESNRVNRFLGVMKAPCVECCLRVLKHQNSSSRYDRRATIRPCSWSIISVLISLHKIVFPCMSSAGHFFLHPP